MLENKLDKILATLANNRALYGQLIEAVQFEAEEARERLKSLAVAALYDPSKVPLACGQGGAYDAWASLAARLRRFELKK